MKREGEFRINTRDKSGESEVEENVPDEEQDLEDKILCG